MAKIRTHSPDKPRIKTQSVKKPKKNAAKPKKTQATRDAEKTKERLRTGNATMPRQAKIVKIQGTPYKLRKFESPGIRALPETYFTRKGMTLKQLIRGTPKLFVNNAVDVEAHRYKKKKTKTGKPVVHGIMWTNDPFRPHKVRRYHETYIVGLDDNQQKPVTTHKKVLVQCTCEAYVYNFEYANARHGAAYLIYSNGEPPVWTNPAMWPGCCKHIIALAKLAYEDGL